MITVMGDQNYSIEFFISFPTIYHYVVCDDGKVPAKIVLLYGGKSSYHPGSFTEHSFRVKALV